MKNSAVRPIWCIAVLLAVAAAAQEVPVVLQVEVENQVRYGGVVEPSQVATSPVPVTSSIRQLNFNRPIVIGDVIAVNGSPARGAWVSLENNIRLTPTPTVPLPGGAISDAMQPAVSIHSLEFLKPDGDPIGTILGLGAVGSPTKGWAIVGGTGAFLGAKGAIRATANPGVRTTSQAEDPSMRRVNGGGRGTYVIHLIPMFRPEVLITPSGPAIAHSNDFSLVTASKPAAAGEILSLFATGLGPTRPGVDPGQPFPPNPLAAVTSPVEVTVNGRSAEVLAAVGFPGAVDGYQVNFRVPPDTPRGPATVQVSSAWIAGPAVSIAVQR